MHVFVSAFPEALPADALDRLLAIGREKFATLEDRPAAMAFWWPRFEKIARWFIAEEQGRRPELERSFSEVDGKLSLREVKPAFELRARADRIDRRTDGTLMVIDYKTGSMPAVKDVRLGLSPQLALEAAIIRNGAFDGVARADTAALEYWRLAGGAVAGEVKDVCDGGRNLQATDPSTLADEALAGLFSLLEAFGPGEQPYVPVPRAESAPKYNDYEHLERIREWSVNQTDEEAGDYG